MKRKVKSPLKSIITNATMALLVTIPIIIGIDYPTPNLSDEMKSRCGQAAALLGLIGALLLSYRSLQSHRYKKQEEEINIQKHKLILKTNMASFDLHSMQQKKDLEEQTHAEMEKLMEEQKNIADLNTTVNMNTILGFIILAVAAIMQVISLG